MDPASGNTELDEGDDADKDQQDHTRGTGLSRFSVTEGIVIDVINQRVRGIDRTAAGHDGDAVEDLEGGDGRHNSREQDRR